MPDDSTESTFRDAKSTTIPFDDNDVMPWGKYRGCALRLVPGWYWVYMAKQPWINDWPAIHNYMKKVLVDMPKPDPKTPEKKEAQGKPKKEQKKEPKKKTDSDLDPNDLPY